MADIINRWNINGVYYQIHDYGRGLPGGVATLDAEGRIPYQQLPLSTVTYKGAWEADINVPDLNSLADVTKGDMYVVISSGRQDLGMYKYTAVANPAGYNPQAQGWYEYDGTDYIATTDTVAQIGKVYYSRSPMGSVMFLVGDRVIWDGQQWERVPAGGVTSVNGKSGDVVLTGNDVALSPDTATSVADTIKAMDYNSSGLSGDFISNIVQTDGKITSVTKGSIPAGPSVTDSAVVGQYVSAVSQSNGKISVSRGMLPAGMSVRIYSSYTTYTANDRGTYDIPLVGAQFILQAYLEIDKQYDEETSLLRLGTNSVSVEGSHGYHIMILNPFSAGSPSLSIPSMADFSRIRLERSSGRWGSLSIRITAFALGT